MIIAIILLLPILVSSSDLNSTKHIEKGIIFNGEKYNPDEYPYVVFIIHSLPGEDQGIGCTGSLVKELFVLTAAHCAVGLKPSYYQVYRGPCTNGQPFIRVVKKYILKDYPNKIGYDLSLLKLEKPFPNFSKFIKIGGTPQEFDNDTAVKCTNIGFGMIAKEGGIGSDGYKMTTLVKRGQNACVDLKNLSKDYKALWSQLLCSSMKSKSMTCHGDSGGPMICNGMLYGTSAFSYDINGAKTAECGGKNTQTVHIFINSHLEWVNAIIDPKPGHPTIKPTDDHEPEKKKKKKKKKKSSGNLIKPHHALHTIEAMLLYSVMTIFLY